MSKWVEIDNYHDEEAEGDIINCISIDGYTSNDKNTQGCVIAKIIKTKSGDVGVVYIDNLARIDEYAQSVINTTIEKIKHI